MLQNLWVILWINDLPDDLTHAELAFVPDLRQAFLPGDVKSNDDEERTDQSWTNRGVTLHRPGEVRRWRCMTKVRGFPAFA